MEVVNSEGVLAESNSSYLNKSFVKGFLAGFVIGFSVFISTLIVMLLGLNDKVESIESVVSFQFLPIIVVYCAMPLLIIYLVGMLVKFALGRYGFEGWMKGKMKVVHFLGALLGLFVGTVTYFIVALLFNVVWTLFVTGI